jgi:hypothetical protein
VSRRDQFETIRTEGALLPAEVLQRVRDRDKELGGLRGEDYGLPPNEPLNEAIVRSYNRLVGAWASFQDARAHLPADEPGTTITRDRWLLVLLQELGYGRVQTTPAVDIDGKAYAVSHSWGHSPIHLVGSNITLERRTRGVAGAATQSPHGTLQELLNRSEERLWGIVSNGLLLRLLRDNSSLTRQAYIEFDLEQMMDGEVYADFVLLWMVCHASRVEGEKPYECWLERWSKEAAKQGTRALEGLRDGVEAAISALGTGFLTPGRNSALKSALRKGELSTHDYYRELLRLVYRLLFLFVAEDRALLHHPDAPEDVRMRYARWYSTRRLRDLAEKRRGTKHGDLWDGLKLVMRGLGIDDGCRPLGLPPLGSFLWSDRSMPHLEAAQLPNRALLEAVRALATVRDGKVLRAVDYRNLGAEELGSVYESLLELHPRVDVDAGTFALDTAAGNERKTTGSYYTPTSLISVVLDTALDPVLDEAAAKGEEALLDLKIVDPACGSGHFLVAAAHRIAKRLASARTGDEEPSPEATRQALRDVVSRCVFGIDVNPMAVELCKVSLWIEALDPGRPLSFLDAHIKCGNSLLGTSAALMADGIPDDAFKALEGDDKAVAKALRKQNGLERKGQLSFEDEAVDVSALLTQAAAVEAAEDTTLSALHEKERLFEELLRSDAYEQARLAADAWCAGFVQRMSVGAPQITTGVVRRLASGAELPNEMAAEVHRLAGEYGFFHPEFEYPDVFGREAGGFDVVLGNPPWERVKLQEKEFFADQPELANAPNAAARKRLIAELSDKDPPLYGAWLAALRRAVGESHLLRVTGRYPLCGRGDVNTYAVFAELMRSLMGSRGRVGCIVPTGIATDSTTQFFFRDLVEKRSLASFYCFKNERFLFSRPVEHTVTFGLLTLGGAELAFDSMEFCFNVWTVEEMMDPERRYVLAANDLAILNPNTRTLPTFRTAADAELTKSIYRRVPVLLREDDPNGNPWGVSFLRMFDLTNDSHLFRDERASSSLPLYEAKLVHLFNHRWATYDGSEARDPTADELRDPEFAATPRWWVDALEVDARLAGRWGRGWLLGWRDIARSTDYRTVIASVIPRVGVGNNMPLAFIEPAAKAGLFLADLSSFVFDYVARQAVGGAHVNFFIFKQLPVLPPRAYEGPASWDERLQLGGWLTSRVLELAYTGWNLQAFARELGYEGTPFCWEADRRFLLRCELDAAFFHLYGVARDDVDYVMDTFPVVRDRDLKAHSEYRTKRVILEIYDELAKAAEVGEPYTTRLDPPPADPRVAHPPRAMAVEIPA